MSLFPSECGASFSRCRTYRYALWRIWSNAAPIAFIGLNPSTADESTDDQTIRRCIGFAKAWGYGGIYMLNLFAYRATDPKAMKRAPEPIGERNDWTIYTTAHKAAVVVAAWGVHGCFANRDMGVFKLLCYADQPVYCLGTTRDGAPRHPLYVPATAHLVPWGKLPEELVPEGVRIA